MRAVKEYMPQCGIEDLIWLEKNRIQPTVPSHTPLRDAKYYLSTDLTSTGTKEQADYMNGKGPN